MWLELAGLFPVVINNFSGEPGPTEFSYNQRPRALLTCTKKWRQPRCRLQAFRPCRAPINRFFKPQVFPGKYLVVERTCSYKNYCLKITVNILIATSVFVPQTDVARRPPWSHAYNPTLSLSPPGYARCSSPPRPPTATRCLPSQPLGSCECALHGRKMLVLFV